MKYLLLILAVSAFSVNSIFIRAFQLKLGRGRRDTALFQSSICAVASIAYLLSSDFNFQLSAIAWMQAILFGVFFASACLFSSICYECGPMSVTSVITNASVIIPVTYGCLFLSEGITPWQIVGIVFLLIAFLFSALSSSDDKQKKINLLWLVFVLVAFVSNGITAVLQKSYKLTVPDGNGNLFMSIAYFTAAVLFALIFIFEKNQEGKATHPFCPNCALLWQPLVFVLAAGLGSFCGNGILMTLSTQLPASVLYPIINGGLCIIVSVFSCIVFKEKLTRSKGAAILVGLCAIIALNL